MIISIIDINLVSNPFISLILVKGPWEKDPHYFKDIQISALALLKMVMHARSGGSLEIMGLLLGKVVENTMVRKMSLKSHSLNYIALHFIALFVLDCHGCICIAG